ncbi:uncharacterized protein PHACADRAFT_181328 [Phanerochaete carnosa HHB-10118-sp]|uniref:F-box domain-containing protein n=1 Tax=Phanerochaete carnosa (strain HHB-10118-sp) TaxID=650164 RepID=K5WJP5_PHACS|nr:uncharacterized protein PHACADRAFT_181328 [Phanerochaete carnosa HHB-10118-sp]EKM59324.1 hypothetical protein PHACADRAFT_181328 [Phanerochaete carnosa HHB-10118-sp]
MYGASLEWLIHPPPSETHPERTTARQLLILEGHGQHIPTSFVYLSAQIAARNDFRQRFPHIVALRAQCETSHCLRGAIHWAVGLGPSLTTLSLRLPRSVTAEVQAVALRSIRGRVPYLQRLEIEMDLRGLSEGQALDLALQVVAFCDDLRSLTVLSLPVEVLETAWQVRGQAVSSLPLLRELSLSTQSRTALSRQPPVREGGFNNLHTLRIRAPLFQCADILGSTSKNLKRLDIQCDFLENAHIITGSLRTITNFCSTTISHSTFLELPSKKPHSMLPANMNALFSPRGIPSPVLLSNLTDIELTFTQGSPEGLRLCTFAPLLSAQALRRLSIRYPYALSYTADDLGDMLGSWHSIQSLYLNPRPSRGLISLSSTPSVGILSAVARCGPCLQNFCALVEGLGTCRPLPERTWAPSLQKLDLGHSLGTRQNEEVLVAAKYIRSLFHAVHIETEDCSDWVVDVAAAFGTIDDAE